MLYLPKYAGALRCVGQALQDRNIEVFELQNRADELHVQAGDPDPPYMGLIEISFSPDKLKILDREGRGRRGRSDGAVRFDSVAEVLRSVGEYLDQKLGDLRRIDNSGMSPSDPAITLEYRTRTGELSSEKLPLSLIRETSVRMYKQRTRLTEPISIFSRRR